MKARKPLSILLALAILLSCIGWPPTQAQAQEATLDTGPGAVTENIQPQDPTDGTNILQYVDEAEFRSHDHVARLREEEKENLNQQIFLNRDGSKTMYVYDHPVKYRDENGSIQDISLDIADTGDADYPFRTKANSAVTSFPAELPDGITLTGGDVSIRMAAQMPASNEAVNHRARRVDTQTVGYTYDAKTTIEYTLTYAGFKEEIVVSEYTGQTEYHFILYTGGLRLTDIGGAYYLTNDTGEIKATIGQVIVFTADERNNTFGEMRTATIKENQIYALTIVLDADYLSDPNTVYPIRIDPTVTLTYAQDGADAIEDVNLQSENVSYPEFATVSVGLRSYGISRLLMKFPGIDFSDYEGVTVTSATVSLRDLMCEGTEMAVYCYPFTGTAWTESTASWATITTQTWGAELDCQVISYNNGLTQESSHRYKFNIAAAVQAWIDGSADPSQGIIFKADSTVENGTTLESRIFGSFEQETYKPIFEMTYQNAVTVTPADIMIFVDETTAITATTVPSGQTVTWTSEDNTIATVDENGVVTGVEVGSTTITATLEDGTSANCTVTVLEKSVTLLPTNVRVYNGETFTINATTVPDGATLEWTSTNENVATVSDGDVTTLSTGRTVIRAAVNNEVYAECTVTVVEFALTQTAVDVDETQTTTLSVSTLLSGYLVTWSSADIAVATVDSSGKVTGAKAGTTTITATTIDGISASCTVYVTIADGVYYIQNCASSYYVTVDKELAMIVRQNEKITAYSDYLWQIWRIVHIREGYYHIRPMAKLDYALQKTNTGINAKYIGDQNISVIDEAKWFIEYDGSGYVFRNKANTNHVLCPMASDAENIALDATSYSATSTSQRWTFIDAPSISNQAVLYDTENGYQVVEGPTIWMGVGETKTLAELGFVAAAISEDSISQNFVWGSDNTAVEVDRETGTITAVGETLMDADVVGRVWYEDGSRVLVWITVCVGPIPNGTYLIQNAELGNYIQINDGDNPDYTSSGEIMELWALDGRVFQRWEVTHIDDNYYKITSEVSGLALSVPSNYVDKEDKALVQEAYIGADRQIWKIEAQADGEYTITPKSAEGLETDYCMAAGDSILQDTDGRNVEQRQYTSDHEKKDHWKFVRVGSISDVQIEGQTQGNWCWVTVAKMYATTYDSRSTGSQHDAVSHVYGSALNTLGTPLETKRAIDYYLPDDTDAPNAFAVANNRIYSESDLVTFLNKGHVVCAFRGSFSDINDPESRYSGHATLICGYVVVNSKKWFLVKDPSPLFRGSTYLISYEKLYNGSNPQDWETSDDGVWETAVVPLVYPYSNSIDYYFNQQ